MAAGAVLFLPSYLACDDGAFLGVQDGLMSDDTSQQQDIELQQDSKLMCPNGIDKDSDGYGKGCSAGPDCNDADPFINPGAKEICDGKDNNCNNLTDEGVKNPCGTCDPNCNRYGDGPFPTDKTKDPNIKDVNNVGLNPGGDLVLKKTNKNFNYMWIANTLDTNGVKGNCVYGNSSSYKPSMGPYCRGTISKIDTVQLKEVARYFTTTCKSKSGTSGCVDLHGKPIVKDFPHSPSRTAVDYNFDVWVANRAFGGQPSATKVANDQADCIDRNSNGFYETSRDVNGDGKITTDCNGDGKPDNASTTCTGAFAGLKPEFYGDDDECILFTINYGNSGDIGRCICLDTGGSLGASNAWVATYYRKPNNHFYRIDGTTGKLNGPYSLPTGHYPYGCVVDSQGILWSTYGGGTLNYLDTKKPTQVGPLVTPPSSFGKKGFYGITLDDKSNIWLAGTSSGKDYRYRPNRTSFSDLAKGVWTGITYPAVLKPHTRGIAADNRGKIWVAATSGYVWRIDQNITDGLHNLSSSKNYWKTKGTGVIGVGVDFAGHIWAISYTDGVAGRMDVDAKGDPASPLTFNTKYVPVGHNPYTYSDFTGYGLQNFTRPQGRYLYQLKGCPTGVKATWAQVTWNATTPSGTSVLVRVRSGDTEPIFGSWLGPFSVPPLMLDKGSITPLKPNPSVLLQVEFTLKTMQKNITPILHSYNVTYTCAGLPK